MCIRRGAPTGSTQEERRARPYGRGLIARVCLGLALLCTCATDTPADTFSEPEVRAVYLYNFASFVEWPADAFESSSSPLRYCVIASRSFEARLREVLAGESVKGRPLELVTVTGPDGWRRCHLLYVDFSARSKLGEVLSATRGAPVLTVGDFEGFAHQGGMIALARKGGRLRTFINRHTALASGIRISSKLLRIANLVGEANPPALP